MRWGFCFLLILIGLTAEARNFSTQNEKFAVYIRGSLDPAAVENTLVTESKGSGVNLSAKNPYKFSGELGVFFASPIVNIRGGIEYVRPYAIEAAKGLRASDETEMYSLDSEVSVVAPKITLELNLKSGATSRFFLSGGYGYAMMTARNAYTMTSAGTSQFNGLTDFREDLKGTTSLFEGTLGYENVLADTTTFVIEGGYRSLIFEDIEYTNSPTNFQGGMYSGRPALNSDGRKRSLDLSGIIAALSFRFWL